MSTNQHSIRAMLNNGYLWVNTLFILTALTALLNPRVSLGQTGLHNLGDLRIHHGGALGFHTHFINNSPFSENGGLAGIYGENRIRFSGAFMPEFHDLEILNPEGLEIHTSVEINGNLNFILGDISTLPGRDDIYLNFAGLGNYTGASDTAKMRGGVQVHLRSGFNFPVGDLLQHRPLLLLSDKGSTVVKCDYYFEASDATATTRQPGTNQKSPQIAVVSNREFWKLQTSDVSRITVDWNSRSQLEDLTMDLQKITLAGWSKAESRWVPLGREYIHGNIYSGSIGSAPFRPDDYTAITFGSLHGQPELSAGGNYILSPNNDGINDLLIFREPWNGGTKSLKIFDRNGIKVFEKINYINEFDGRASTGNFLINPGSRLPEGIYYYLLRDHERGLNYQGFLHLER